MSDFEAHRSFLVGLAYRMLGSVAEAEDVAQDAYLRWSDADRSAVAEPRAYLARIVTRLCLDRMKSARARREEYVGTWLPEPLEEAGTSSVHTLADDLSVALLLVLERLSPLERAAFLLHDVFDMDYAAIADVLEREEPAVRQLAARGRDHVKEEKPRFAVSEDVQSRLAGAFFAALVQHDVGALQRMLAEDAVMYTDGGGKRRAALNPIYGREKILRFFEGVAGKRPQSWTARAAVLNGLPGVVVTSEEGVETMALEIAGDQVVAIYGVRNPDKLRHLS